MTKFKKFRCYSLALASILTFVIPNAFARDISLPKYSSHVKLADIEIAHQFLEPDTRQVDTKDPIAQVVSVKQADVWGRIRAGFSMPDLTDNRLIVYHENYFTARPESFTRISQRGAKYLFHIVTELEKRKMPTELALLPFIESAYNPHARSIARAEGLWQFIPSTGRRYDLSQNAFTDERRSVIASTQAALNYLQELYGMFGDWHLALASYNWGEGAVARAVKKAERAGKPINFNSIASYMPAETRNYVPKFQAVKNMIAHPERYGLTLPFVENEPYFVTISKTQDIDVSVAAKLAQMDVDEFKSLNPQFGYVITGGNNVKILLPKENAEKFERNLSTWTEPLSSWTAYQVSSPRETLNTIAAQLGVSPITLQQVNHIPPNSSLKLGSAILVPKTTQFNQDISPDLVRNAQLAWDPPARGRSTRVARIKVRHPTSVAALAKRYHMSVAQFKAQNGIRGNTVNKGTVVRVKTVVSKNGRKASRAAYTKGRKGRATRVRAVIGPQKKQTKKGLVKSKKTTRQRKR